MNVLEKLFPTSANFFEYAPGFEASITLRTLNATAVSCRKIITDVISQPIWDQISDETDTDALLYLRSAFANLVMHKHKIFFAVDNRLNNRGDTYKYELEGMKRIYIDNYHNAMSSLLMILSSDSAYDWTLVPTSSRIDALRIATAADFDSLYAIDTSFLYFWRTIPIQLYLLNAIFDSYYRKIADRQDLIEKLDYALVFAIVARSLRQFDIIEFPPTMRNYFDDNTVSRNGKDERAAIEAMAAGLSSDSDTMLRNIDLILQDVADNNITSLTSVNEETNKHYYLP